MYSGLDRRVHFSAEDLANGAIDLAEVEEEVANNTMANLANSTLQAAANVVREAAPRFIETIINHLLPVSPAYSGVTVGSALNHVGITSDQSLPQSQLSVPSGSQNVVVSPPVATIIILPAPNNISHPTPPITHDTVQLN
jgi:hypothetical protein